MYILVEHMFRDDGGFPHYDVPYGGLPPPPVAGALPPPAWMPGSGAAANKGQVVINCPYFSQILNFSLQCFHTVGGGQEGHPACKKLDVGLLVMTI